MALIIFSGVVSVLPAGPSMGGGGGEGRLFDDEESFDGEVRKASLRLLGCCLSPLLLLSLLHWLLLSVSLLPSSLGPAVPP
jgi:hypothetical protein